MADLCLQVYTPGCLVLEAGVEQDSPTYGTFAVSQPLTCGILQLVIQSFAKAFGTATSRLAGAYQLCIDHLSNIMHMYLQLVKKHFL